MKRWEKILDAILKLIGLIPDKAPRPRVNRERIEMERRERDGELDEKHRPN